MRRIAARPAALLLCAAALALGAGCGKKAPLLLPDQVKPEKAGALRATVREGVVSLRFRVPARRIFPEREEPWVLARVLRREGESPDFAEVGAILDTAGLPFEGELSWEDEGREAAVDHAYRVEFRDARRRRRALSSPLLLSWPAVPGAPRALAGEGTAGAVTLSWEPPEGATEGLRYRVYRAAAGAPPAPLPGAEVSGTTFSDSRVQPGLEYCYEVRGVLEGTGTAVEGPASAGACVSARSAAPLPAPSGLRARAVGRGFQLTWEAVASGEVAGYAVYRAVGDGAPARVTAAPVTGGAYLDDPGELPPGTRLRWTVTAVGRAPGGAESAMSEPAVAILPAP